jgi:hypothetical protein
MEAALTWPWTGLALLYLAREALGLAWLLAGSQAKEQCHER